MVTNKDLNIDMEKEQGGIGTNGPINQAPITTSASSSSTSSVPTPMETSS